MKNFKNIKVETVQYGYALTINEKQWLLEDEQHLAEAIVFRVGMGCQKPLSRKRMRKLLNIVAFKAFKSKFIFNF